MARKVKTISISVPANLADELKAEAGIYGVSVSAIATIALRNRYQNQYGIYTKEVTDYGKEKADFES